jgi:glycosyltransferase involved in cell wall biosynthesis
MLLDVLLNDARVHVISPSVWLAKMAETIIASKKKVHVIRNPIPRVENLNKLMSKETYDINPKKFVIGFVSMQLDNPLKGLRDLGNAIKLLPTEILDRLHLLLIGKSKLFLDEERITQSFIKDPTGTIGLKIYQLMDVLVVPSRQDNSPNVIGEALMNGTPIIGSKVGGIPELMREFNCQVVNTTDAQSLANAIIEQTTRDYSRSYLARRAEMVFGYTVIGSELKNLYESSL